MIRIWTNDIPSNESIILHPLIFADTGHIAFIYQMINHILCCQYFAVFSKTGVIDMQISTTPFAFCLHTYRLDNHPLQISQQCSLNLRVFIDKIELISPDGIFTNDFDGSTLIIADFPDVLLDQVHNKTFAVGRIFQETKLKEIEVKQ